MRRIGQASEMSLTSRRMLDMGNVLQFRLKRSVSREHAMRWLIQQYAVFPFSVRGNGIGEDLFHGWRFVESLEGIVYFANCIEPGISRTEFMQERLRINNLKQPMLAE